MNSPTNELLNPDVLKEQVPAWFYKRMSLFGKPIGYFLIPIDIGFSYLLRSIRTKWQGDSRPNGTQSYRQLKIEFVQSNADRLLQNDPYYLSLISTPAQPGVEVVAAPSAYDQTAFGVNMTATPVKNNLILNHLYQRRETLDARLKFKTTITAGFETEGIVDILFQGYYLPDRRADEWQ